MASGRPHSLRHRRRHKLAEVAAVAVLQIPNLYRKHPPGRRDDLARSPLAAEQRRHRPRVQRGAHHDNPQVGPQRLPQSDEQAEDEVHLQRSFVKLVEHHGSDRIEDHVAHESPQHDAGRLHDEPRVTADARLEPYLITDFTPRLTTAKVGNLSGHGAGCKPPRLEEHHLQFPRQVVEHRCRHEHRLARARRCRDDHGATARCLHDRVENGSDRKVGGKCGRHRTLGGTRNREPLRPSGHTSSRYSNLYLPGLGTG